MSVENTKTLALHVEHRLEHHCQRYNWDCGVACVLMVLPKPQREELLENFTKVCHEEGFGKSTWSIDLCYLLKRFGVRHCMYTTTLGVNENLRRHRYYSKVINMDRERVQQRFDEARSSGVMVVQRSLSIEDLRSHLEAHGPAIVLVDARLLACDVCHHNKLQLQLRRWFGGGYKGHYVVVVGHTATRLLYRDPAVGGRGGRSGAVGGRGGAVGGRGACAAPPALLQRAARAAGTDHDIILVFNNFR